MNARTPKATKDVARLPAMPASSGPARCRAPGGGAQRQCADDGQLLGDWPPHRGGRATGQAARGLRRAVDRPAVHRPDRALRARVQPGQPGKYAAVLRRQSPTANFRGTVSEIRLGRAGSGIHAALVGLHAPAIGQGRERPPVLQERCTTRRLKRVPA